MQINLEIKKIGRCHCVVAGVAVLGKFRTSEAAAASLAADAAMYAYWAGSAGVAIQNTPAITVSL